MNVTQKRSFLFLFTGIAVAAGFAAALRLELYRHLPRPHQLIFMMALLFIDVAAVGVLIWGALRLHSRWIGWSFLSCFNGYDIVFFCEPATKIHT